MLQMCVRLEWILTRWRKHVDQRCVRGIIEPVDPVNLPSLLITDLLLEQRVEHDRGGAGILEPAHAIEMRAERRRPRHEGVLEAESEIRGVQRVGSDCRLLGSAHLRLYVAGQPPCRPWRLRSKRSSSFALAASRTISRPSEIFRALQSADARAGWRRGKAHALHRD